MSEGRDRTRYTVEETAGRAPTVEGPGPAHFVGGCLVRLVLFVLVLIALAVGGLFLLMSGGFL